MYKSCEVYRCFYNKDGYCLYDESPLQPVSIKACYDYDEEYLRTSDHKNNIENQFQIDVANVIKKKSRTRILK